MAKYRVWAESITAVYIDIEANSEIEAMEAAEALDGGDYHEDGGDWVFGQMCQLDPDDDVDFTYEEVMHQ